MVACQRNNLGAPVISCALLVKFPLQRPRSSLLNGTPKPFVLIAGVSYLLIYGIYTSNDSENKLTNTRALKKRLARREKRKGKQKKINENT